MAHIDTTFHETFSKLIRQPLMARKTQLSYTRQKGTTCVTMM